MSTFNGPVEWPDWERYSQQAIYNTKAVVQQTGVPAPTLRAWERRYALLSPVRAENTYRLYSERDIALVRWLKNRVESGISISHAVELYRHRSQLLPKPTVSIAEEQTDTFSAREGLLLDPYGLGFADIPFFQVAVNTPNVSTGPLPEDDSAVNALLSDSSVREMRSDLWKPPPGQDEAHTYPFYHTMQSARDQLIEIFQNMDESRAIVLLGHLFSLYSVEQVCTELVTPTLWELGRLWAVGAITVSVEHFATNFFRGLFTNMLHVTPISSHGPLVLTCCAPGEPHELAILMVSLFLRRGGLRVLYLGQSIETTGLMHTVRTLSPALVCVSLTLPMYMLHVEHISRLIAALEGPRPLFAFGGQAFRQLPEYAKRIAGIYCDGDLQDVAAHLHAQVMAHSVPVK